MYFVMRSQSPIDGTRKSLQKRDIHKASWLLGVPFDEDEIPPDPLRLAVNPDMPGDTLLDFYKAPVSVMRTSLAKALNSLGVDNLDIYPVVIIDEEEGQTHDDYVAFNVIGLVAAADLGKSDIKESPDGITTALDIDRLEIDETATHSLYLFRLKESIGTILVHERIKNELEKQNFVGLVFDNTEDFFSGISP